MSGIMWGGAERAREDMLRDLSFEPRQNEKLKPLAMSLTIFNVGSCGGHWGHFMLFN